MRNHDVYFEIYGKKMKASLLAKDKEDAKQQLFKKIRFHKIEADKTDHFNGLLDMMDGFLNILKKKLP